MIDILYKIALGLLYILQLIFIISVFLGLIVGTAWLVSYSLTAAIGLPVIGILIFAYLIGSDRSDFGY